MTFGATSAIYAQACLPLTPQLSSKLAAYVAAKYDVAPDIVVEDKGTVGSTCFRQLEFQTASSEKAIYLYLTPDQRYLAPDLLDTTTDLRAEKQRVAQQTETQLVTGQSPVRGAGNAKVTIVEFSDLQCPACKRFEDFLTAAISENNQVRENVRVIYKHRPLSIHDWARRAAQVAVCANLQSEGAFWEVHDYFYKNQSAINAGNFEATFAAFLRQHGEINGPQLHACVAENKASAIIERDESLADEYNVNSTPTVYINGTRTKGFRSEQELVHAIHLAIAAAASNERAAAAEPGSGSVPVQCTEAKSAKPDCGR